MQKGFFALSFLLLLQHVFITAAVLDVSVNNSMFAGEISSILQQDVVSLILLGFPKQIYYLFIGRIPLISIYVLDTLIVLAIMVTMWSVRRKRSVSVLVALVGYVVISAIFDIVALMLI